MSRGGHAGHMTQLIVERMAALEGPATVDEIIDAVAGAAHVPWNYIFQSYQQYKCTNHQGRGGRNGSSFLPPGLDPQLGWSYPGFDAGDPQHRRKALTYVVRKRLHEHNGLPSRRGRQWAVQDPDGRWRLSPDESQMPMIRQMNGTVATFDAETRAEIDAGKAAQVAVINRTSDRRTFDLMPPAEQAALLRWLTDQLPASKSAATKVRPVLTDWKRRITSPELALEKLRDLVCRDGRAAGPPLAVDRLEEAQHLDGGEDRVGVAGVGMGFDPQQ